MSTPDCCPYCRNYDIRLLGKRELEIAAYRCHGCSKTFYVGAVVTPRPSAPGETWREGETPLRH